MKKLRSKVAGVSFYDRQEIIERSCNDGDDLILIRDEENEHSDSAVGIWVATGFFRQLKQIGFVTAEASSTVAEYLDDNENSARAVITEVTGGSGDKPSYGVNIEITLDKNRVYEGSPKDEVLKRKWFRLAAAFFAVVIGWNLLTTDNANEPKTIKSQTPTIDSKILVPTKAPEIKVSNGWQEIGSNDFNGIERDSDVSVNENGVKDSLVIICRGNHYTLYVDWHQVFNKKEASLEWRFDSRKPGKAHWLISEDRQKTIYRGDAGSVVERLIYSDSLTVKLRQGRHARFSMNGLYSALIKSDASCLD